MCFVVGSEPFASVLVDRPSCSQRCPAPRIDPGLRAFVGPRAAIDSCPSARSAGENLRFVRRCVVGSERLASFKSCVTTGPLAAASPLSVAALARARGAREKISSLSGPPARRARGPGATLPIGGHDPLPRVTSRGGGLCYIPSASSDTRPRARHSLESTEVATAGC